MGPGTDYLVIDNLPPDAHGLKQVTCVPLQIPAIFYRLTEEQRQDLPQSWCLMRTGDLIKAGWVAQRFLEPDWGQTDTKVLDTTSNILQISGDLVIDKAAKLVRDLYVNFEAQQNTAQNPFGPPVASQYFFAGIVSELAGRGADVLYNAQDFQGEITQIAAAPVHPMLRGTITINVEFTNFGQTNRALFSLRPDTDQPSAPIRIFRIEHSDWIFPR